ncbi:MAG: methylmalonyl-CoA mutase family protein [Dehalococcoidia bacterium]|nr:methylmalonyl-CoA mutase family protein [Dehalococcoidia bacterium]
MVDKEMPGEIEKRRAEWEEKVLKKQLARFGVTESPQKFYTPLDIKDHDFLKDVGFPGQYPFTAGKYASLPPGVAPAVGGGHASAGGGLVRAGRYSGYGTAEDTRDYYKFMIARGRVPGINLAFDLPTQCGYDSDAPEARGEVGKTGVAIDTLRDFEVLYEPFTGEADLDRINSAWTINPLANVILAMYIALAKKRDIPITKLNCTPQNDILKECVSRGTHIFPLKHAMRLIRDTIVFGANEMPGLRPVSINGHHPREAGASREQVLGFHLAFGIAYVQLGIDAGLDIDSLGARITFNDSSGSLEMFKEIAYLRAARRMWAKIMKERFGAKDPRSMIYRDVGGCMMGHDNCTVQRPLNNLIRSVIGGVAEALSGYVPTCYPPFDEALGLGHSMEAIQLEQDAARIIMFEAGLCDVADPLAGSYYVEYLTDELEKAGWEIINKIDEMGGMVAAIESGWLDREIAKSAYAKQKAVETGEQTVVGVNKFVGEGELEITINRMVPDPYDPEKRARAEERQIANLSKVKKDRDNQAVKAALKRVKEAAQDDSANTIPPLVEAVEAYATVGEITNILKEVFGTYQEPEL